MKGRTVFLLIFLVILADQALKIYIKTHYTLGQSTNVAGQWFKLYFIENEGMAYGMKFGGDWGKLILTLLRLAAVIFGVYYIKKIVERKYHRGFILCAGLIFAGALGNLIDSMFYGLIFEQSGEHHVAGMFNGNGYTGFLKGKVVDMLYFPVITGLHYPQWFPVWGGESFEFFRPIFNIADASISSGVIAIILFQKRFFRQHKNEEHHPTVETNSVVNDEVQVS